MKRTQPETEITEHECRAMRALCNGDYTHSELAFLFECTENTVSRHVKKDCHHDRLAKAKSNDPMETYTDEQLLRAYRVVYEKQPYEDMSAKVYDEYKPDEFPSRSTIHNRFGSWIQAREAAHE